MANETRQILIDSILGGEGQMANFSGGDQFLHSLNIDPSIPISWGSTFFNYQKASGLLNPVAVSSIVNSTSMQAPAFIVPNPKDSTYYVYGSSGSVYIHNPTGVGSVDFQALSDGGSMSNANRCGAAYYDNYIYFAKNTTIARYGPLDGTPAFNGDYWVGTLGKTQLTNYQNFITDSLANDSYPQHVMHRHSDGKLYIADRVDGQAYIHKISTTKTTVEGDTDNGSEYLALALPRGMYVTAIESYGANLAIALFEGAPTTANNPQQGQRARLVIWDTTSQNYNFITNNEFPDELISAMKNVNGNLYLASGNRWYGGFRVTLYVGGFSFLEVAHISTGQPPFAGAMLGDAERLIFGSDFIYSIGLQKSSVTKGLFKFIGNTTIGDSVYYSLAYDQLKSFNNFGIMAGWYDTQPDTKGIDVVNPDPDTGPGEVYSSPGAYFVSKKFIIGRPFKIKKVRIPLAQVLTSGMQVLVSVGIDDDAETKTLTTISSGNYSTSTRSIVQRPVNLTGSNNFFLKLQWNGTEKCVLSLPIIIEYEELDIESSHS